MNSVLAPLNPRYALLTAVVLALGVVCGRAQQGGNFELLELKTTLEVSARKIGELEAQIAAQKSQVAAMAQSLAAGNAQAAQCRESYEKLRGLLDGLGVGALESSTDQVQERLLAALKDFRMVDEQKQRVSEALMSLSESALLFAKSAQSSDPAAQKKLDESLSASEKAIRSAGKTKGDDSSGGDLHNLRVVGSKAESGLLVFNLGSRDGVKIGMPFAIYRQDRPVAKALVVDVRKSVCGAVVQEMINNNDPVQIGDHGKVAIDRTF